MSIFITNFSIKNYSQIDLKYICILVFGRIIPPTPPQTHSKMQLIKRIQEGRQIPSLHMCRTTVMHKCKLSAALSTNPDTLPPDGFVLKMRSGPTCVYSKSKNRSRSTKSKIIKEPKLDIDTLSSFPYPYVSSYCTFWFLGFYCQPGVDKDMGLLSSC